MDLLQKVDRSRLKEKLLPHGLIVGILFLWKIFIRTPPFLLGLPNIKGDVKMKN
jgi:hypothetical protein